MKVSCHPPLLLAPSGSGSGAAGLIRCDHAALWLSVRIEAWQVARSGHLHLLREPWGTTWREVDLSRHPLRALPDQPPEDPARLERELWHALAGRGLSFFRIAALGLVSEIGEGRDDFRRRAMGGLRPQLQRGLANAPAAGPSSLALRQPAAERGGAGRKEQLASELSALAGTIEIVELEDLSRYVRRAEVGLLLVDPDVRLEAPRYRPLMI